MPDDVQVADPEPAPMINEIPVSQLQRKPIFEQVSGPVDAPARALPAMRHWTPPESFNDPAYQQRIEAEQMKMYRQASSVKEAEAAVFSARKMLGVLKADREIRSGTPVDKAMYQNLQFFINPADKGFANTLKTLRPPSVVQLPDGTGNTTPAAIYGGRMQILKPPALPATIQEAQTSAAMRRQAETMRQQGKDQEAEDLDYQRALIEGKLTGPKRTIEVTPEGVRFVEGGKEEKTGPTTAFKTKLQEQLHGYEDAMGILQHINQNATESDFGVRGVSKELWARIGGQLGASIDPQSMDVRKSIGLLRASLYKSLRSDANIAEPERRQIESMLPSEGLRESLPDALAALNTTKNRLVEVSRSAAKKLGVLAPVWALTPPEIQAAYKAKKITKEEAVKALRQFHNFD